MKIVKRTPRGVYNIWIKALRSDEYQQTDNQLKCPSDSSSDFESFCCLGVLCDLAAKDGGEQWNALGHYGSTSESYFLPTHMRRYIKMHKREQQKLIKMNDTGESFRMIANEIEKIRDKALKRKSVL